MGAVPPVRRRPVRLTTGRWAVVRARGDAGGFHRRAWPSPAVPTVWVFEVDRPTVVLGSTQPWPVDGGPTAEGGGIEVVRRHSGGGAVLLRPGGVVWVDVLVPGGDPRWDRDVNRAFMWLGRAWAAALGDAGVRGADVHQGPVVRTQWSPLVCFAGLGPGEVTVRNQKVVGISCRRRREGALFQCAALVEWDATGIAQLVGAPTADLQDAAAAVGVDGGELVAALLDRLAAC